MIHTPPANTRTLPGWARAADYFSILLILVALTIAGSGGFRIRLGGWRFALTSPYRVIFWAVAIELVRHFFVRDLPIYRHLPAQMARWFRATSFRAAAASFIGTRPAIFLAGYLAVFVFGYPPGAPPYRDFDSELLNLPLRWDVGWYLQVSHVNHGYMYEHRRGADIQQNIVFFPAFPITVRVIALLFGGDKGTYLLAGTVVSLAAFFGALIYLYLLARDDLSDEQSRAALWLLSAFPFAYFYGAVYPESLFLLGSTGAFYHLKRREFVQASVWGLIVGLTRPNGFLLSVPLAVMAISPWLPKRLVRAESPEDHRDHEGATVVTAERVPLVKWLATVAMPVIGMLIYSAFIWSLTGNPFAWLIGHAAWGRHYTGLTTLVSDRYNYIANAGLLGYVSEVPLDFLNLIGVAFVLAAVWPVARRLGLAYAVFILVNMLPPLAQGGMLSAGRVSATLFPAFIWFAGAVSPRHRPGWLVTFAANQALNAALFYTWRQLF